MDFSLNLKINNISHSFDNKNYLFKNLNYEIESSEIIAITGPNGSGKSTLIKIIASLLKPSNGNIELYVNQNKINIENYYLYTSLVSPYLNLYEEFTGLEHIKICDEFLNSHSKRSEESKISNCHSERSEESHKSLLPHSLRFFTSFRMTPSYREEIIQELRMTAKHSEQTISDILNIFELKKVANDQIRTYSSGQKQRLKYILALLKEPLVCLFDEPFTNLDDNGINIAKQFIDNLIKKKRIVIIASNDDREIELSNRQIELI